MTDCRYSCTLQYMTDGGSNDTNTDTASSEQGWGWSDVGVLWVTETVADSELLEVIRALSESGTTASRADVREHSMFHPAVYVRQFGSWTAALEEAGVLSRRVEGTLDEEVLDMLKAIADGTGRPVTPNDLTTASVEVEDVLARFGRWNNALAEARVELVSTSELSEDEQFLLYDKESGGYRVGFGEHGFFRGWGEHHAVLEFLVERGEERFTVSEFASSTDMSEERVRDMLEFVASIGRVRRDDDGWVVRVDETEEVAGWLREGRSVEL